MARCECYCTGSHEFADHEVKKCRLCHQREAAGREAVALLAVHVGFRRGREWLHKRNAVLAKARELGMLEEPK